MQGQMTIMDFVKTEDKTEPKFQKGQRVYNLILDVVKTGEITDIWKVSNYYGYRTSEDNIVFWDDDTRNIFTSKKEAYAKADKLKDFYEVIRSKDMKVIKERNFVEACDDSRILISATVKLLKDNTVYYNNFYTYHFLEKFETEKEAEKKYNKELEENLESLRIAKRFEVDTPVELRDMYLCENGRWSEYRYAERNGPVVAMELFNGVYEGGMKWQLLMRLNK